MLAEQRPLGLGEPPHALRPGAGPRGNPRRVHVAHRRAGQERLERAGHPGPARLGRQLVERIPAPPGVQEIRRHRRVVDAPRAQGDLRAARPGDEGLRVVPHERHVGGKLRPARVVGRAGGRRVRRHAVEGEVRRAPPEDGLDGEAPARAEEELAPPRRVDHRHGLGRQGHGARRDLAQQRGELELGPERAQPLPLGLPDPKALQVELDGERPLEDRQLTREEGLVAMARQRLTQLRAGDHREIRVERLEAPELPQELLRRHLPHPRHAGDVVDRVAHQREDVGDAYRRHAPLLLDLLGVVDDALAGTAQHRQHRDARVHELERVLVGRHQHQLDRGVAEPAGRGRQDVVGLVPGRLEQREPHRLQRPADPRDLLDQVLRHPGALELVCLELLVPERRARRVPGDPHVARLVLAEQLPEHHGHPEGRVGRQAARGREMADGVVGAVEVRRAVHQIEALRAHASPPTTRKYSARTNSAT